MSDAVPNRRRLAPTSSEPTTAEIQAQRHGIPAEISAALQGGVSMRIRQAAATGRQNTFARTQSTPVVAFNRPGGFVTHQQALEEAQTIISREELRRRELKPFSSNDSDDIRALNLSPRRGSPDRRRLKFRPDGTVTMEGEADGSITAPNFLSRKRDKADDDDDKTEVDEDEPVPTLEPDGSTEFPPVFESPRISVPELFQPDASKGLMLPPPVPAGRDRKLLPSRALAKTVSAPSHFGRYDVDMEDGFDVAEWAKAEPR